MTKADLDLRLISPRERHPRIFGVFDLLPLGESVTLVNDHDPRPLHDQLATERKAAFDWHYLEEGPDLWRVRITKLAQQPRTNDGSCCGGCCGG
jgi:uncharacterized protein (DUF2249 family)